MAKAIKEIIIMLMVCLLTMLILAVVLYRYVPNKKVVPNIKKYEVSTEIADLLEDDIDTRPADNNVILTYEVTSSDLAGYQKSYNYVPGKANPFAKYTPSVEGEPVNVENKDKSTNNESNMSNNENTEKTNAENYSIQNTK